MSTTPLPPCLPVLEAVLSAFGQRQTERPQAAAEAPLAPTYTPVHD